MQTKVMGIVNVTPDSFSDGGRFYTREEALRRARKVIEEGADIVDFGGESTRPGATPLGWEEEWRRLEQVIAPFVAEFPTAKVSVDTYHPETAERALGAGATIINCVVEASVGAMLRQLRDCPSVELVLPASVATEEVMAEFGPRLYLDPMIGFTSDRDEDLRRLKALAALAERGRTLVGVSRKRIVKKLVGEKAGGKDLAGNLALALWCARHGADVLRVHDVAETVRALKIIATLDETEA